MSDFLPYFKMYAAETLSDERFQGWTVDERGAWLTLLLVAWREGSVPSDHTSIAKLLHVDAPAMRLLWSAIGSRFVEHPDFPGRLTSPRLEREREEAIALVQKKKIAGKAGADSRWNPSKHTNGKRIAAASDGIADPMRLDGSQHNAEQSNSTQHSSSKGEAAAAGKPAAIPSKADHLASQYPLTQALLDALALRGWILDHASASRRKGLETALEVPGCPKALESAVLTDLEDRSQRQQETIGSIGFYLGEAASLAKRQAPPEPSTPALPVLDLSWLDQLPEPRRSAAHAAWTAKAAEVETYPNPSAVPRLLADWADAMRQQFTDPTRRPRDALDRP